MRWLILAVLAMLLYGALAFGQSGLHVRGRLMNDTADLQPGYFVLCGESGACQAKDAIGITVHPENRIYLESLTQKVGHVVQVSIF